MTASLDATFSTSSKASEQESASILANNTLRFGFFLAGPRPRRPVAMPGHPGSEDEIVNINVRSSLPIRPKGLRWSEFPVIRTPEYPAEQSVLAVPRRGNSLEIGLLNVSVTMTSQRSFFYDETFPSHFSAKQLVDRRYFAARLYDLIAPGKPILALFRGEKAYRQIERADLLEPSRGWHHYHHNYTVNFAAIGCKAVDYVIDKYSSLPQTDLSNDSMPYRARMKAQNMISSQTGYFAHRHSFLIEPYGLQVLYSLRNSSPQERRNLFEIFSSYPPKDSGPQMTFGGHVGKGQWLGSGKYQAKLDLQEEIGWVIHDAAILGLVDMETNAEVRLTDAGQALLDIMHTDNYDPDAFLRFTDPETLTMAGSQIERIDAWMTRFFRKMRMKVDGLRT
jgi:hypothetical protein